VFVMPKRENDPREHRKLLYAGVVYLAIAALLLALSTAIYLKVFDDVTRVTLETDRAGMQLARYGDVRYNGVLVGQIRGIRQTGEKAEIELALEPESARAMPRDVDASILPTTLFGRKYVSLDAPARGGPTGIRDGTVIPADRVTTTVELGRVLSRLYPLLRTVRPVDLNKTLSALANALNGRGERLGETLVDLDSYLTDINVHLPTLQEDLRLLASVARTYEISAPDLLTALANLTVTSETVVAKKQEIGPLFDSVTSVSATGADLLEANEEDIVRALDLSRPVLALLDKYHPQHECLLRGIATYKPLLVKTFEGGLVKQFVEFPNPQHRAYDRRDLPAYKDKRGPRCYGLPDNPPIPWPGVSLRNGTDMDTPHGRGNDYSPQGGGPSASGGFPDVFGSSTASPGASRSERRMTNAVLGARTGRSADGIPALATLMYGPLVRAEVGGGERA
jgi:phospholipid/cholesterol/gamma-HCH transport system substrate-binding protein